MDYAKIADRILSEVRVDAHRSIAIVRFHSPTERVVKILHEELMSAKPTNLMDAGSITEQAECLEKATEISKILNQNIYVSRLVPERNFGSLHPKWVIFFEQDPWVGGIEVRPDGSLGEMAEYT